MSLTILLIVIFLLGIACVAFEEQIGVNKSATALLMSVLMWVVIAVNGVPVGAEIVAEQLGDVSETLFFVLGALVIVELVDVHGGFDIVTNSIKTLNKRKFLWIVAILTFLLSAILDNIATAVIMVALVRKFVEDQKTRWTYAGVIILAANAGGSFSPVGDVTTILLWTGGNLTPGHQIASVLPAALTFMVVPTLIVHFAYFKRGEMLEPRAAEAASLATQSPISKTQSTILLLLGVSTMALVPFFQNWSTLPPFMRILLGLSLMWIYTDIIYRGGKLKGLPSESQHKVNKVLSHIDMSTILFFLGVLMSVAAMKVAGTLVTVGEGLEAAADGHPLVISFIIGVMSSFVDNVALVAATQGMYPIAETGTYIVNSEFWTFLAYCAVTGGSLLIIGSATGVTVMGVEKLTFGYYLKRFTLLALAGYIAGAAVFMLI